jgi:hypothetical protein
MKAERPIDWPEYVSMRQGVKLGRENIAPITMSRARRDRAEGRLPDPDSVLGNVHLWRREKFIDYLRGLLRKPPPKVQRPVSNDNSTPPAAA